MALILGFDISSSCIGYALVDLNLTTKKIKVISYTYYKPTKKGSILDRLFQTQQDFRKIIADLKPDYIAIEDIVLFMKGHSTAKTITTLTSFNRMLGLLAYEYLGKAPQLYSVMKIRHGLKLSKELPQKEEIPTLLEQRLKIKFQWEYNKNKKIKVENYDKADALAVATFHALTLSNQLIK